MLIKKRRKRGICLKKLRVRNDISVTTPEQILQDSSADILTESSASGLVFSDLNLLKNQIACVTLTVSCENGHIITKGSHALQFRRELNYTWYCMLCSFSLS